MDRLWYSPFHNAISGTQSIRQPVDHDHPPRRQWRHGRPVIGLSAKATVRKQEAQSYRLHAKRPVLYLFRLASGALPNPSVGPATILFSMDVFVPNVLETKKTVRGGNRTALYFAAADAPSLTDFPRCTFIMPFEQVCVS
ncbi:hypothetical protein N7G274_004769 [Stereocaulon virgatum]|uniref:Uncharacterized protein n=1 Tax=Stereocaulon virgatum TaxID=373712 RepID=A0ABR4AA20_9LECA